MKLPGIQKETPLHQDMSNDLPTRNRFTAIYYVNSNDGYTVTQSGERIKSEENTAFVFNSHLYHGSCNATNDRRIVINFNFM